MEEQYAKITRTMIKRLIDLNIQYCQSVLDAVLSYGPICFASRDTISTDSHIPLRTLDRHLKKLVSSGILKSEYHHRHPTHYIYNNVTEDIIPSVLTATECNSCLPPVVVLTATECNSNTTDGKPLTILLTKELTKEEKNYGDPINSKSLFSNERDIDIKHLEDLNRFIKEYESNGYYNHPKYLEYVKERDILIKKLSL